MAVVTLVSFPLIALLVVVFRAVVLAGFAAALLGSVALYCVHPRFRSWLRGTPR